MVLYNIIVAHDNNNGIGKNNSIPWYLSEDFSYELRFSHFQVEKCSLSSLDNYPVGILTAVP